MDIVKILNYLNDLYHDYLKIRSKLPLGCFQYYLLSQRIQVIAKIINFINSNGKEAEYGEEDES